MKFILKSEDGRVIGEIEHDTPPLPSCVELEGKKYFVMSSSWIKNDNLPGFALARLVSEESP
jgi:hypothetical protein